MDQGWNSVVHQMRKALWYGTTAEGDPISSTAYVNLKQERRNSGQMNWASWEAGYGPRTQKLWSSHCLHFFKKILGKPWEPQSPLILRLSIKKVDNGRGQKRSGRAIGWKNIGFIAGGKKDELDVNIYEKLTCRIRGERNLIIEFYSGMGPEVLKSMSFVNAFNIQWVYGISVIES